MCHRHQKFWFLWSSLCQHLCWSLWRAQTTFADMTDDSAAGMAHKSNLPASDKTGLRRQLPPVDW